MNLNYYLKKPSKKLVPNWNIASYYQYILLSLQKGNILDDEKRLNVGISRAKKKLILIGCKSTLLLYKPFERLINILNTEQFVNIPENYLTNQ